MRNRTVIDRCPPIYKITEERSGFLLVDERQVDIITINFAFDKLDFCNCTNKGLSDETRVYLVNMF